MTIEQMKESLKTIKLLEKDLMRDLTEEEKEVVMYKGWEEFLFGKNYLGFSEDDYKEMKALRAIISAFYTQSEEELDMLVQNSPKEVYFVLRELANAFERNEQYMTSDVEAAVTESPIVRYTKFMTDLYSSLPEDDSKWFDKLTEDMHTKLFKNVYLKELENPVSDDALGGIMTDAVKDYVIEDMVAKLKNGEEVEMTNAEYLEVADYLCNTENKFFLNNDNGNVTLKVY